MPLSQKLEKISEKIVAIKSIESGNVGKIRIPVIRTELTALSGLAAKYMKSATEILNLITKISHLCDR